MGPQMLLVFLQGLFDISRLTVELSNSRRGSKAGKMVVLNSQARGTSLKESFRKTTLSAHWILADIDQNIHIIFGQQVEKCD